MYSTIVLQDGPISEVGVNGDQIDDLVRWCRDKLVEFNVAPYETYENGDAIAHLNSALGRLAVRTAARTARGVEGTSNA